MTIEECLGNSCKKLKSVGIQTARLDSLILLEDILGKDRSWLLAHPDHIVRGSTSHKLQEQIERRARHEPLAYIRGKSEFYGREFLVTPDTLEPRPETETMVDLLKYIVRGPSSHNSRGSLMLAEDGPLTMVDVGTGSGCIAITAKLEFPELKVFATEINTSALKIAQKNTKKLGADVTFHQGNLLEPIKPAADGSWILLANLPYVPDSHTINEAAMFEPKVAIFGGADGLDLYRQLFEQIKDLTDVPAHILTESLPFQHKELIQIAKYAGYKLELSEDFIQLFIPSAQLLV